MRFLVATYNVHKCRGMDWRVRPDRVAAVLCEMDAEVIALTGGACRSGGLLCAKLKLPYVFGAARGLADEEYGNALFSKFAVTRTTNHDITIVGREERNAWKRKWRFLAAASLHVLALHLGTFWSDVVSRRGSCWSLRCLAARNPAGPFVLLGDFNEWTAGATTRLLSASFAEVDVGHTFWAGADLSRLVAIPPSRSHLLRPSAPSAPAAAASQLRSAACIRSPAVRGRVPNGEELNPY